MVAEPGAVTPEDRLSGLCARMVLAEVPLERRYKFMNAGKTLFGGQKTVWEELEPAWLIGDLEWEQPKTRKRGPQGVHASGVTAEGEVVAMGDHIGAGVYEGPPPVDRCLASTADVLAALEQVAARAGVHPEI